MEFQRTGGTCDSSKSVIRFEFSKVWPLWSLRRIASCVFSFIIRIELHHHRQLITWVKVPIRPCRMVEEVKSPNFIPGLRNSLVCSFDKRDWENTAMFWGNTKLRGSWVREDWWRPCHDTSHVFSYSTHIHMYQLLCWKTRISKKSGLMWLETVSCSSTIWKICPEGIDSTNAWKFCGKVKSKSSFRILIGHSL